MILKTFSVRIAELLFQEHVNAVIGNTCFTSMISVVTVLVTEIQSLSRDENLFFLHG